MNTFTAHPGKTFLATGAVAFLLAACGGNGGTTGGSASDGTGSSSAGPVSVASVDGSRVLTTSDGHTLYSASVEKGGNIHCVGPCTSFWRPVAASASAAPNGKLGHWLGTVHRPDGGTQLTYKGMPLYTFTSEGAGQLKGDGFTDDFQGTHFQWSAVRTAGSSAPSAMSSPSKSGGGGYGY